MYHNLPRFQLLQTFFAETTTLSLIAGSFLCQRERWKWGGGGGVEEKKVRGDGGEGGEGGAEEEKLQKVALGAIAEISAVINRE